MAKSAFGRRLKEAFSHATNKEIAEKIGVSPPAVQNYADGRIPPAETLIKIASVTKCDLHWLLTGQKAAGRPVVERQVINPLINRDALVSMVREIVQEELRSQAQDLGAADEFDLEAELARSGDPHQVMSEWFRHEGRQYPRDYGVVFFQGWETFTPEEKVAAVRDAKKVLDRTLKLET